MKPEPPGTLRVASLLARVAIRRWVNRIAAFRRRKKPRADARTATARKTSGSNWIYLVVGPLFLFQAVMMSGLVVSRLADQIEAQHPVPVEPSKPGDMEITGLGGGAGPEIEKLRHTTSFTPSRDAWIRPELESELLAAIGWILLLLAVDGFFNSLAGASNELSQPGWGMEWLFGFPVRARSLFFAKVWEYAFTNVFLWFTLAPFLFVVYFNSGHGWWAIPLSLAATLCVACMVAALRLLTEISLRKRLSADRLKNARALFTLLGLVFFFGIFMIAFSPEIPAVFMRLAGETPAAMLWIPFLAPALWATGIAVSGPVLALTSALLVFWCVRRADRLVEDGLIAGGGAHQGRRGRIRTAKRFGFRLRGVLGKELLLLVRDRNLLVQTLVTPLFVIGFQVIANPTMFSSRQGSPSGAIVAFGVGAYVLLFGAFSVLAVEKDSLWLLFTFPRSLAAILRRKVILWGSIAAFYTMGVLVYAWHPGTIDSVATFVAPFLAIGGIFIFASIAAGLGCLATDPLAQVAQRRVRPGWTFLYMLLIAMYGYGIYTPLLWPKFVTVVLSLLLTYAIWQKVAERLPLLLDPTQRPASRVTLSDGLIAAAAFFQLSSVFSLVLVQAELTLTRALLVAYGAAGFITVMVTLFIFSRAGVPHLRRALGLDVLSPRALGLGVLFGAGCALVAAVYLAFGREWFPALRKLREASPPGPAIALLAVGLAPPVEEFIFRGLIFRGMRQTLPLKTSIVGSAFVFAIVHPPHSFVPIFVLGLATAACLHRTRSLWAPIAAHATYNLAVVFLPRLV